MDNIFGEELKNSGKIFMPYIKDMKLKSTNEYFYIIRDNTLGDVLFVNNPTFMHFSYSRYIENRLRETFDFTGTPISIVCRERK